MRHSRTFFPPLLRLSGLAAAVTAGLIAASTGAGATTAGGPAVSPAGGANQPAAKTTAVPYTFSCDFSGYGGSAATAGTAMFTVPETVTLSDSAQAAFKTPALPLTPAMAQKLASADTFTLNLTGLTAADSSGTVPKIIVYPGVSNLATSGAENSA